MTVELSVPRVPREVPDWHDQGAACQLFPELDRPEVIDETTGKVITPAFNAWFDAKKNSPAALAALIICSACPVRLQCATGALERRERWGTWGGLNYDARKQVATRFGYEVPGDAPEHGTNARRVKWGCTCPDCKRAHAVYEFDRRARAAARRAAADVDPLPVEVVTPCKGLRLDLASYRRRVRRRRLVRAR